MRTTRHVETLEGVGTLTVRGDSYPVRYSIEVFQEFHSRVGSEEDTGGTKDPRECRMSLLEDSYPNLYAGGNGSLMLEDGRHFDISVLPTPDLQRLTFIIRQGSL